MIKTAPHFLKAIWYSARTRFGDGAEAMIREMVGQETGGRTTSTREMNPIEAHRVLDRLNAKDPDKEAEKRKRYFGPVRSGARPRARPHTAAVTRAREDEDQGDDQASDPKILRCASIQQMGLLRELATQAGLTAEKDGHYSLDDDQLRHWMGSKFGVPWAGGPLREDVARRAIAGLKSWVDARREKWAAAKGVECANATLQQGLPYRYDQELRREAETQPAGGAK